MKHYKYNRLTAHLMVDCFLLIRFEFQLTVSSFLSCFSKRVYNFFYSVLLLFVFLLAFVSFSNIKLKRKFFFFTLRYRNDGLCSFYCGVYFLGLKREQIEGSRVHRPFLDHSKAVNACFFC